jgi:hypothetical protein
VRVRGIALAALASWLVTAPALAQQGAAPGMWQPGTGAAGDNTYVGVIDMPTNGSSVPQSGMLSLSGWFVDTTAEGWTGADDVQVFLGTMDNGTALGHGVAGLSRPDVGAALANPFWSTAGWRAAVDSGLLASGEDVLSVYLHTPSKGWWSLQVTVEVGQPASTTGEILAPAPALQGPPPVLTVSQPAEGQFVSTRMRSFPITGTATDPNGGRGIDWVEVWLNGEANSALGVMLGTANQSRDGSWTLPFDPGVHPPINSNVYVYAHSAVTGKTTLVVRHFYLADRAVTD